MSAHVSVVPRPDFKQTVVRSFLTVLKGAVIAQAIGFLVLPILSRQFAPEAFGHFQLYTSIINMLAVVAALRLEVALLSARDPEEYSALLWACAAINLAVAALAAAAALLLPALMPEALAGMEKLLWLIPAGVISAGALQTLGYAAQRQKDFAGNAASKVLQVAGYGGSGLGAGALGAPPFGLVAADIVGRGVAAVYLAVRGGVHRLRRVPLFTVTAAIRAHRNMPLLAVPGGLVSTAAAATTPLILYGAFSPATSGQFGLADRSLTVPTVLIATSLAQVVTAELAERLRARSPTARDVYRRLVRLMAKIAVVPAILLLLAGPSVFALVFGEAWRPAGEFARIGVPLYFISFVVVPVNMTILLTGRQALQLGWEVGRLLLVGVAWWATLRAGLGAESGFAAYVAAQTVAYIGYLVLADRVLTALRRDYSEQEA